MLTRAFLLLLLASPAFAQDASLRYATMPDLATAQALSASAWQAMRCTPQPTCDPPQLVGPISSGTYTSGTGAVSLVTSAPHGIPVGAFFTLSGMTGTGSVTNLNAEWTATTGTIGATLNFTAPTGLTLTISGGVVSAAVTKSNYPIIGLSDLTRYAIVIHTGDVYQGEHLTLPNGKSFNLTAGQIASLATRAGMGTLLPDILPIALVNSRVTAPELSAINTYGNTHPTFKTNFTALTSGPIDLQNPLTNTVFNELQSAAVLTAARIAVILAPQAASP